VSPAETYALLAVITLIGAVSLLVIMTATAYLSRIANALEKLASAAEVKPVFFRPEL
jgi:hypothetical protein